MQGEDVSNDSEICIVDNQHVEAHAEYTRYENNFEEAYIWKTKT